MRRVAYDTYECEICGTHYETPGQAQACEAAGRPVPRYAGGAPVRFRPGACPEVLRDEEFTVAASTVALADPAWAAATITPTLALSHPVGDIAVSGDVAARHVVSYVLNNHRWRVGFIAEHQLVPITLP